MDDNSFFPSSNNATIGFNQFNIDDLELFQLYLFKIKGNQSRLFFIKLKFSFLKNNSCIFVHSLFRCRFFLCFIMSLFSFLIFISGFSKLVINLIADWLIRCMSITAWERYGQIVCNLLCIFMPTKIGIVL